MAGSIVSYSFSAVLSATSGDIAIGDWLVKDTTGNAYVKATSANRAAVGGYVEGISLDAASSGGAVRILTVGPIPKEVTGLTSGAAGLICVDSVGRTVRYGDVTTPIVGWCYAIGDGMIGAFPQSTPSAPGSSSWSGPTILNVREAPYNAVGDGTTDDLAAIQAAIDDAAVLSTERPLSYTVYLPPGDYRTSGPIILRARCKLMGPPGGYTWNAAKIVTDADQVGIYVPFTTTASGGIDVGYGSQLENLYVTARTGTSSSAHGLKLEAQCFINNVIIYNFPGNGINIDCDVPDENFNAGTIYNVRIQSCKGRGIYLAGGDANAVWASGIMMQDCVGGGIYDNSFLGSHWASFQLEACQYTDADPRLTGSTVTPAVPTTLGNSDRFCNPTVTGITITLPPSPSVGQIHRIKAPSTNSRTSYITINGNGNDIEKVRSGPGDTTYSTYILDGRNQAIVLRWDGTIWDIWGFGFRNTRNGVCHSTVFGGYVEGDCGNIHFYSPGTWMGGDNYGNENNPNGMLCYYSDGAFMDQRLGFRRVLFSGSSKINGRPSAAIQYARVIDDNNGMFWAARENNESASVGWSYGLTSSPSGYYALNYNSNWTYAALAVSGTRGAEGKGRLLIPRGVVISPDNTFASGRHITFDSAAPTSSHNRKVWRTGDMVLNSNGAAGQPIGWRATQNGGWASRGAWASGTAYECGDTITPSTPNGYIYRCEVEGTSGGTGGISGVSEPSWTTTYGATFNDNSGQITWVCVGVSGPAFETGGSWGAGTSLNVAANTTITASDQFVYATAANVAVTLPASPTTGEVHVVKAPSTVTALTPVQIIGNGKNIDGSTPYYMNTPYQAVTLRYNGTEWSAT